MSDREQRAQRAAALLNDPTLQEAFEVSEQRVIRDWMDAETVEERERAWYRGRALREVQQELRLFMADGQHAAAVARRE